MMQDIAHIRRKLEEKRANTKYEQRKREVHTEILQLLYAHIPRQEDMKKRTDLITTLSEELIKLF